MRENWGVFLEGEVVSLNECLDVQVEGVDGILQPIQERHTALDQDAQYQATLQQSLKIK